MPLLECVPNLSEGRRPAVIDRLASAATAVAGAHLLHRTSDPDHNRTVLTLAGEAEPLRRALLAVFEVALETIDLTRHEGVHPRLGAVDVVPFVPLGRAVMADAVAAARRLGAAVARRWRLPVFLYEEAAGSRQRRNLADVRRGGFEGLPARLADPAWQPDFGPTERHPTAGATAVGARFFLVAFNAVLASDDLALARAIARRVREAGGGLPGVKALGLPLASRGRAQVSMNLTDYRRTDMAAALAWVRQEARRRGSDVEETELIGLAPTAALGGRTPEELLLRGFSDDQLLERRLAAAGL